MLEQVKLALRITEEEFEDEILRLIEDCLEELARLGVTADEEDPQIISAVVAYCKWQFGDNDTADRWRDIYSRKLAQFKMMTGYTNWGGVDG